MVDCYGRWTYEPGTPEEKKCDCDRIADWIVASGYTVKTSIENVVIKILLCFDCVDIYANNSDYGDSFNLDGCKQYVIDCGGIQEFDFVA